MQVRIHESWSRVLRDEFAQPYFTSLAKFVRAEYARGDVYPPPKSIFRAFDVCPFDGVRVVVLGQDPYHGPGQANGLCFAVEQGMPLPPSLHNVYKEIEAETGVAPVRSGDLERWARQGVLLLNSTLTVRKGMPGSHQGKGWEQFTDAVVRTINDQREHVVFLLWGAYAKKKGAHIDRTKHLVLEAAHPSPLSAHAGFFGCGHFTKTNAYLESYGSPPIAW